MPIPETATRAHAASGALLFDTSGRLLLVKPTYKAGWEIPGGVIESGGETPQQACAREIKEELGLDLLPSRLLVVDWAPLPADGDKVLFVFDGGVLSDDQLALIRLPADELTTYDWVPPADIASVLVPRLARRVRNALAARQAGLTVYLEHGRPLTMAPGTE